MSIRCSHVGCAGYKETVEGWCLTHWDEHEIPLPSIRQFETGANRDTDHGKYDYEAFLSPRVLERFARYMHEKRHLSDGTLRDGDNWQKGMPRDVYMKSAFRHFMDWWTMHRNEPVDPELMEEALCAMLFNVQGYLFEVLREPAVGTEGVAEPDIEVVRASASERAFCFAMHYGDEDCTCENLI